MHLLRAFVLVTVIKAGCNVHVSQRRNRDSDDDWSYHGDNAPDEWPGLCLTGRRQSPLDLSVPKKPLIGLPLALEGSYKKNSEFEGGFNGHVFEAHYLKSNAFGILRGGSLKDVYIFKSLHVHWGSEHTFRAQRYSAEMHLVHYNAKYTPEEAANEDDGYAVLGIFLEEVDDPPSHNMTDFLSALTQSEEPFKATLRDILPEDLEHWIRYEGSLTTPGCSENVIWTVFEQIVFIRKGIILPHNHQFESSFRPPQPLNNRTIYYSLSESNSIDKPSIATSTAISQILLLSSMVNIININLLDFITRGTCLRPRLLPF